MRALILVWMAAPAVWAQSSVEAATQVARDYLEGWYEGNCERMEAALDATMAKRRWMPPRLAMETLDRPTLVSYCRGGGGTRARAETRQTRAAALEASARGGAVTGESGEFLETLLVAPREGRMRALGILWLMKRDVDHARQYPPADAAGKYAKAGAARDTAAMKAVLAAEFLWFAADQRRVDHARMLDLLRKGEAQAGAAKVETLWQRGPLAVAAIRRPAEGSTDYVQMGHGAGGWRVVHVLTVATK